MVFEPASVLLSARSGLNPPECLVLMPDRAHLRRERFELRIGRIGGIVYAFVWLIAIPTTGIITHLISTNPLVVAAIYLFGFTTAVGCLLAGFCGIPRSIARRSQQALILVPGGLILGDWSTGEVQKAVDYRATDDLKLKWVASDDVGPSIEYLLIRRHGKLPAGLYRTISPSDQARLAREPCAIMHVPSRAQDKANCKRWGEQLRGQTAGRDAVMSARRRL